MKIIYQLTLLVLVLNSCKPTDEPPQNDNKVDDTVNLTFKFNTKYNQFDLSWNSEFITNASDTVKFQKIKYLISNFTLEKPSGELVKVADAYGFISLNDKIDSFVINKVPKGAFKSIRFDVGLDSPINHGNPAQWALTHPLNPSVNDMHWGWSGGYIFNVVEGTFKKNGLMAGFSFHVATLKNARTYTYVEDINISKNSRIVFDINADKYFSNAMNFSLKTDGSFSHSGDPDPIMVKFMSNSNGTITFNSFK